jgi:hypothetical protein
VKVICVVVWMTSVSSFSLGLTVPALAVPAVVWRWT